MKTVIEMAREATLLDSRDDWNSVPNEYREAIERFAEFVRADEREACAKACENWTQTPETTGMELALCAAAIRARSNT